MKDLERDYLIQMLQITSAGKPSKEYEEFLRVNKAVLENSQRMKPFL